MTLAIFRLPRLMLPALLLGLLFGIVGPPAPIDAGALTYSTEHQFQFSVPAGWSIKLDLSSYGEPDLKALAQIDSGGKQEINVYQETLGATERTALQYLQNDLIGPSLEDDYKLLEG